MKDQVINREIRLKGEKVEAELKEILTFQYGTATIVMLYCKIPPLYLSLYLSLPVVKPVHFRSIYKHHFQYWNVDTDADSTW